MPERILLIDSDIFILLAGADILDKAIELLGFKMENLRRLDALPYQLRGKKFRKTYAKPVLDKALAWCERVASFVERPADDELQQALANVQRIDPGEAVMLGLLAEQEVYLLASGDKASMRALAQAPELAGLKKAVSGRVICLETILRLLLTKHEAQFVARSFAAVRIVNTTLRVVFSQGEQTPLENCLVAVDSYFADLVKDGGNDCLFNP